MRVQLVEVRLTPEADFVWCGPCCLLGNRRVTILWPRWLLVSLKKPLSTGRACAHVVYLQIRLPHNSFAITMGFSSVQPDSPSTEKVKTVTRIKYRARCRQAWRLCQCSLRQPPHEKPPCLLHPHHLRVANSRSRLPRMSLTTSRTWCRRKRRVCRRRRQNTTAPTKTISRSQGNCRVRGCQAQLQGIWCLRQTWHHSGKSWLGRPGRCKCLHVPRNPRGRAHSAARRCVAPLLFASHCLPGLVLY